MGFRICYILAEVEPEKLGSIMGLEVIGETSEPAYGQFWSARQKNGWSVLWSEDELFGYDNETRLLALSQVSNVYYGIINETVMASTLWAYAGGEKTWEVHWQGDGDLVRENLTHSGDIPQAFHELVRVVDIERKKNPDEDYFMVPVELCSELTGFVYDGVLEAEDVDKFRVLEPIKPHSSGFWKKLFGARK